MSNPQLKIFSDFIEAELGIVYSEKNYFQLEKRLEDICKNLEVPDIRALWLKVTKEGITGHFKQLLLDVATNNETSFFRDNRVFKAIENQIIPSVRENNPNASLIRIWSVASSFGQEPYSLGILLNEMSKKDPLLPRFEIWATDISEIALKRAKEGKYSQLEVQRGMPAPLLVKYFAKTEDDYWQIKPEIKLSVRFSKMNLLELFGVSGTYDIVLCRNVLIYQRDEKKKEILKNLSKYISSKGFLILGAAESLMGLSEDFNQVHKDKVVVYQKKE